MRIFSSRRPHILFPVKPKQPEASAGGGCDEYGVLAKKTPLSSGVGHQVTAPGLLCPGIVEVDEFHFWICSIL